MTGADAAAMPRRRVRPRRGGLPLWPAFLLPLACAGGAERYDPGPVTPERQQVLAQAERSYRAGEPWDELRAQIVADPVSSFWFTRMLVSELLERREGSVSQGEIWRTPLDQVASSTSARTGTPSSDPLLRAAAGQRDPVATRALEAFDSLGAAAVPCVCEDLLVHEQTYVRQLGVELLGRIGPAALPALAELQRGTAVERRTAAQAIAAMAPDGRTFAELRRLAGDADFDVRGTALAGMPPADAGVPGVGAFLRERLAADEDPFVRRAAAQALGGHPEPATAEALIAYLERCDREGDSRGAHAAQAALQRLAGRRGQRTAASWRSWAHGHWPGGGR